MDPAALAAMFGLTPADVQFQLAHLHETERPLIMGAVGSLATLATIAVLLRIFVRWRNKTGFKADDYAIFVALILTWGSFISFYYQTRDLGLGIHIIAFTPKMIHGFGRAFYANNLLYMSTVLFTQLSLLFLYRRVFTIHRVWFRNILYGITVMSLTTNIACLLAFLFQCRPIKKGWDSPVPGHCISTLKLFTAYAALALVIDVSIVVAPMPLIWTLHASFRYKAAVCGMFLLGSLVCIINGIKIYYLLHFPKGDVSWKEIAAAIWTYAQMCLGIVGACLPCLKPLFGILHHVLSSITSSSAATSTPNVRSAPIIKQSPADSLKTLEGKGSSSSESDIALVSRGQWTATPSFPGQSSSIHTKSVIEAGFPLSNDVERGLSSNKIGVIRDVDVSSLHEK